MCVRSLTSCASRGTYCGRSEVDNESELCAADGAGFTRNLVMDGVESGMKRFPVFAFAAAFAVALGVDFVFDFGCAVGIDLGVDFDVPSISVVSAGVCASDLGTSGAFNDVAVGTLSVIGTRESAGGLTAIEVAVFVALALHVGAVVGCDTIGGDTIGGDTIGSESIGGGTMDGDIAIEKLATLGLDGANVGK